MFILNNEETEKIDDFLNKKGFQISKVKEKDITKIKDCGSVEWEYKVKVDGLDGLQTIEKHCSEGKKITTYSSYNSQNYQKIKNEIIELGYKKIGENYKGERLNVYYRKGNYVIIFFKSVYDKPQFGIKKNSYQIMLSFII
jgi:hypothetical protein